MSMSTIQNEIDRITQNIANTYATLQALGADMPEEQISDNLSTTAGTAKVLMYIAQLLTNEQKAQARDNIGAIGDDDLQSALAEALTEAKESGEFDGKSVTVSNVSESSEDRGSNIVTFSDGTELTVRNGSSGTDGVSVVKVEQTVTSSEDGGTNEITVTLSNSQTFTFTFKNGSKGSKGDDGSDATVTKEAVESVLTGDVTTHKHSQYVASDALKTKLDVSGGTLTGKLVAQNNTNYSTPQVRNIAIVAEGSTAPSGGNGDMYFTYV